MAATSIPESEQAPVTEAGRRLRRWSLVCIGLTPLAWVPAILASLDIGPGDNPWTAYADLIVLIATPPAVAFVLACLALRLDRRAGTAPFLASAALLAYSAWLSLFNITSIGALIVIVLAAILWRRLATRTAGEGTGRDATRSPAVATVGFALGVLSCMTVLPFGIFFTPPVAIPALVVSIVGAWRERRRSARSDLAVAGIVYALLALVAVTGITVATGWA